jgi:hypothetical protein
VNEGALSVGFAEGLGEFTFFGVFVDESGVLEVFIGFVRLAIGVFEPGGCLRSP